jgi:transcription initiation factor TFIIIB Brf1 subunit/transcription initiation factor TFIIB
MEGKRPGTLAGVAVMLVISGSDEEKTLKEISEHVNLNPQTLRDSYNRV